MKLLDKLYSYFKPGPIKSCFPQAKQPNVDEAEISLFGLDMILKRKYYLDIPHEISLFVPRAEIRHTTYEGTDKRSETEMILNSITIVHAPHHPLTGKPDPAVKPGEERQRRKNSNFQFKGGTR